MPLSTPIRLIFAEDYRLIRTLLHTHLANESTLEIVGQTHNLIDLVLLSDRMAPDVVLIDFSMSDGQTSNTIYKILEGTPQARVIILSEEDDDVHVLSMAKLPIWGYVLKTDVADYLTEAIHAVHNGTKWYSPSLQEILDTL